ncbi:MAG: acyl carrier protein [Chlorobi bacterium]|nr:acyl carrier protein [Chlorobiota bacterium]
MAQVTDKIREEVREIVYDFFAEECEIDVNEISDESDIFTDLGGDSLMFLALIEIFTKKYGQEIDLKTIGKYSIKHPVETIGQLIDMQLRIIEYGNKIIELDD